MIQKETRRIAKKHVVIAESNRPVNTLLTCENADFSLRCEALNTEKLIGTKGFFSHHPGLIIARLFEANSFNVVLLLFAYSCY